jgi:tetratricopeptide (TPR) repeat protein
MRTKFFYPLLLAVLILSVQAGSVWSATSLDSARESIRLGKYDRALKLLNAALEENPIDTDAHLAMTEYYLALQDYRSAELSTERVLVLNPSYAPAVGQAYYAAGERAMKQNQPPQALALYETAIAVDPALKSRVKGKYMTIGNDLLARGRFTTALSAYTQEIWINPAVKKTVADTVFSRGQALLGSNDKAAEMLFSHAVSLDSSYGPKVAQAKTSYGQDLLSRAKTTTGEERRRLKEQSLRYVSKEVADQAVPPAVWKTVFKEEYTGKGMNDEDGVIMTPRFGTEVKPGDRIVIAGKEFQFLDNGWQTHRGSFETISKSMAADKMVGIRAERGEKVILEVQRLIDQ